MVGGPAVSRPVAGPLDRIGLRHKFAQEAPGNTAIRHLLTTAGLSIRLGRAIFANALWALHLRF